METSKGEFTVGSPPPQLEQVLAAVGPPDGPADDPAHEVRGGAGNYLDFLRHVHAQVRPRGYLEIGVRRGDSLQIAACPAVGVDPVPAIGSRLADNHVVVEQAADDFFADEGLERVLDVPVDLAFIDGMHLFEFVLRDFANIEARSLPTTVVLVDDIAPNHPIQAARDRRTQVWAGDVWKMAPCLRELRPDLVTTVIDTAPTGMLLVVGLDPGDTTLVERHHEIVDRWMPVTLADAAVDADAVVERRGAVAPDDPALWRGLAAVAAARDRPGVTGREVGEVFRDALGGPR